MRRSSMGRQRLGGFNEITTFALAIENKAVAYAEVAQLVEHNLAKVRVAGSSPVFRSRPPGWWNGRHEGLKILWLLQLCGFKSRSGYERRQIKVCRLFVFLQYSIKNTPIFTPFTYYLYSIFIYRKHTYFVQKRIYLQPYKSKNKIWIPY